jgi:hypothetical protein
VAKKMNSEELLSLINAEESQSVGYYGGEVSEQRRKAMQYYYGQPLGNEVEGRSKYVSHDVSEAIESVLPALIRIFWAGDDVVRFEPQNPNDELGAKQATDYVNYVVQRQNNGFVAFYAWFKDALLQKNGFLKVYWEKSGDITKETYEGLTDDEFTKILMDKDVEPIEHSMSMGESGEVLHDLKVQKDKRYGKICIDPVPPEEVLVARGTGHDLKKARFVAHRCRRTVSEWRLMGYDVGDQEGSTEAEYDAERIQRRSFDEDYQFAYEEGGDKSQRQVWGLEAYIKVDFDGDGIAELRKVLKIGNKIHDNEEVDRIPFVTLTPIIVPHKLIGLSLADLVMDIQELKSTFIRQMLDNLYNLNNGRYMVLEGMVNLNDALNSTPGGVVRVKTFDAMKRLDTPQLPNQAWQVLEYLDMEKENRTGISKYSPSPDENVLNKTATGAEIRRQRIAERIELIARIFAETGVKDLFYAVLELAQKYQDKEQMIKLRDQWVSMNPREWSNRFDMAINVGLGTGSKQQVLASIGAMWQMQLQSKQIGANIVTDGNLYNTLAKFAEAAEMKGDDLYVTHPEKLPPAQPQPDPALLKAQMDNQAKMQTAQMKDQTAKWKHLTSIQAKQALAAAQMQTQLQSVAMSQKPEKDDTLDYLMQKYEIDKDDQIEILKLMQKENSERRTTESGRSPADFRQ